MSLLLRTVLPCILTFAIGVFIGHHYKTPRNTDTAETKPPNIATLKTRPVEIQPSHKEANSSLSMEQASTTERLKALAWFKANALPHLEIGIGSPKLQRLSPEFVSLFKLSSTEEQEILAAQANAKRQYIQIASQAAKLTGRPTPDDIVIDIPELPAAGGKIYDDLLQSFRNILGPERYPYFDLFSIRDIERLNDSFGTDQKRYEIHRVLDSSGNVAYSLKIQMRDLGTGGNTTIQTNGYDSAGLMDRFPEIAAQIPSEFKNKPAAR